MENTQYLVVHRASASVSKMVRRFLFELNTTVDCNNHLCYLFVAHCLDSYELTKFREEVLIPSSVLPPFETQF